MGRGDGETYIGDLCSQAAVSYSNHAAFRPSHIPEFTVVGRRLDDERPSYSTTADHRRTTDRPVPATRRTKESGAHHRHGSRRAGGARAPDGSAWRARRHGGPAARTARRGPPGGSKGAAPRAPRF